MDVEEIVSKLEFNKEIKIEVLRRIYDNEEEINEMAKTAFMSDDLNFPLCKEEPLTRLSVIIYLLVQIYDKYKAKNIPDSIIFDTFKDISLRSNRNFKKTGKIGITEEDVIWFRHIIDVSIFKIGSLQFEISTLKSPEDKSNNIINKTITTDKKIVLPEDSSVLICHIQRDTDLSPNSVLRSFNDAIKFFRTNYPYEEFKAFICDSWLLYPPMQKLLPDNSNIKQFASLFTIIESSRNNKLAMKYIFDKRAENESTSNFTYLQKMALKNKDDFGSALGIIYI